MEILKLRIHENGPLFEVRDQNEVVYGNRPTREEAEELRSDWIHYYEGEAESASNSKGD